MIRKNILIYFSIFFNVLFNQVIADEVELTQLVDKRPEISYQRKDIQESKEIITNVISNKPFVNIQHEKVWSFKDRDDENKEDDELNINPEIEWLSGIIHFITMLIEAALWFVPVLVAFYLYHYREYWLNLIHGNRVKQLEPDVPETLFGLDIRQESLPDDIEVAARELWKQKHYREAVSLLYRGSLVALFKKYRFELPPGATEQDCIRQIELSFQKKYMQDSVNASEISEISYVEQRIKCFKNLTDSWVSIAYAHSLPDDLTFNKTCKDWNQYFASDKASD